MAIKKSELYSSLWASCDELRGGMDASEYKDYVLIMLFIKYISDKYAGVPYAAITVPKGASFKDMVALNGKSTIGDDINKKIIAPLEQANKSLGSIKVDFDNPEKGVCVFYGRDRGEEGIDAQVTSIDEFHTNSNSSFTEFLYLFTGGNWWVYDNLEKNGWELVKKLLPDFDLTPEDLSCSISL